MYGNTDYFTSSSVNINGDVFKAMAFVTDCTSIALVSSSSSSTSTSSSSSSKSCDAFQYFSDTYWNPRGVTFPFGQWDAGNQEWDTIGPFDNIIWLDSDDFFVSWTPSFAPVWVDITIDNITGGSSTFEFNMPFKVGTDPIIRTGIALSNGQTYRYRCDTGGSEPDFLRVENEAGGGNNFSITNIVFNTNCPSSSSSSSRSSSSSSESSSSESSSSSSESSSSESSSSSSVSSSSSSESSSSSSTSAVAASTAWQSAVYPASYFDSGGVADTTWAMRWPAAALSAYGNNVRVELAYVAQTWVCGEIWIGVGAGGPDCWDYASAPSQFLFSGGPSKTINASGIFTDWLSFTIAPATDYVIRFYQSSSDPQVTPYTFFGTGTQLLYSFKQSVNEASSPLDSSGYSGACANREAGIVKIEVF